jgi:hypothetical protein
MLRHDAGGRMLWRFSMATVAEAGPFSQFPDIERNLTVISGPGFDLAGGAHLRANLLQPVAFAGDIALRAQNVAGVSVDFNVMTHRSLPLPHVELIENTPIAARPGATLCLFALDDLRFDDTLMACHDLLWDAPNGIPLGTRALAIHLFTNPT